MEGLIKTFDQLKEKFPDWEVIHSGGGVFLMRKNFKDRNENDIMVSVGDENVVVIRRKGCDSEYISLKEYKENGDFYWEYADEHEVVIIKKNTIEYKFQEFECYPIAKEIFDSITLSEIMSAFIQFSNFQG